MHKLKKLNLSSCSAVAVGNPNPLCGWKILQVRYHQRVYSLILLFLAQGKYGIVILLPFDDGFFILLDRWLLLFLRGC